MTPNNPTLFISTLFHDIRSIENIVENVDQCLIAPQHRVRLAVLASSHDVVEVLQKIRGIKVKILHQDTHQFILCSIKSQIKNEAGAQDIEWLMVNYKSSGVLLIIALSTYDIFKNRILKLIRRLYPRISRVYFNTREIYSIIRGLEDGKEGVTIRLTKIVANYRIHSRGAQKRIASAINWTDILYTEAFNNIFRDDAWVRSIEFTVQYEENKMVYFSSGSISRDGLISCRDNFRFFFYRIVSRALNKAIEDRTLFSNRGREDNQNLKVRPLSIVFPVKVFQGTENNKKLINALAKLPNSALSVIHSNPYLHASMIDYQDGSSYRLWVLSEDRLIIAPQIRATVASLERIFNHIGESFMEGNVIDFSGANNA